jgi:hypothetical protein
MRTMRSNYITPMFPCYTTSDNLPDSSKVLNELAKEPRAIGKVALLEEESKVACTVPP